MSLCHASMGVLCFDKARRSQCGFAPVLVLCMHILVSFVNDRECLADVLIPVYHQ